MGGSQFVFPVIRGWTFVPCPLLDHCELQLCEHGTQVFVGAPPSFSLAVESLGHRHV